MDTLVLAQIDAVRCHLGGSKGGFQDALGRPSNGEHASVVPTVGVPIQEVGARHGSEGLFESAERRGILSLTEVGDAFDQRGHDDPPLLIIDDSQ
jgi:hypothetical protein